MPTFTKLSLLAQAKQDAVSEALCGLNHYQPVLTDEEGKESANPESPVQFSDRIIMEWVKEQVWRWREVQAVNAAKASVQNIDL